MAATPVSGYQALQQWIHSLTTKQTDKSYLILIEYSQSWSLRTTEDPSDTSVYTLAQLRTPRANARRQWQSGPLLLEYLALSFANNNHRMDWLVTVPWNRGRRQRLAKHLDRIQCYNTLDECCCDDKSETILVIESLRPLLLQYKTWSTLYKRLCRHYKLILLPIRVDEWTSAQHQQWEHDADAVVDVRGEELLRRGVREPDQWIRTTLNEYEIVHDEEGLPKIEWETTRKEDEETSSSIIRQEPSQRKPIQLELQEGSRVAVQPQPIQPKNKKQPTIIVEDDDPEFDDYDEEDPDDDLDL